MECLLKAGVKEAVVFKRLFILFRLDYMLKTKL